MKCEDALLLISGHLDHMNTEEEEHALQAHLKDCAECRGVLQAFKTVDTAIVGVREKAPEDLCAGVMAQIRSSGRKKKIRPWFGVVAAALLLVVGVSAVVDFPGNAEMPQTASVAEFRMEQKSMPQISAEALAQQIAQERSAAVAVVHELYYEIETYPCETLEGGGVLYVLPDRDAAVFLHDSYGCVIYEPENAVSEGSYALLIP